MSKQQWIKENLKPGEIYAGIVLGENGAPDYHLIVLDARDNKTMDWNLAMKAAKDAGGQLPDRRELRLLWINARAKFENAYYWSGEQFATYDDYAWCQHFGDGNQNLNHKSFSYRVRPVRRILIIE